MDFLASALQYLKGVGPRRAADLQRVGLHTIEDLLYRFPTRYEDRGSFQTIASLKPGVSASVVGEVVGASVRPTRRPRFRIFELLVRDRTGAVLRHSLGLDQPLLVQYVTWLQQLVRLDLGSSLVDSTSMPRRML